MDEITESDLLKFIEEQLDELPRRPVGFGMTPLEFAKQSGRSRDKATSDLEKLVTAGTLACRMMASNNSAGGGWRGFVYARPDDWAALDKPTAQMEK